MPRLKYTYIVFEPMYRQKCISNGWYEVDLT